MHTFQILQRFGRFVSHLTERKREEKKSNINALPFDESERIYKTKKNSFRKEKVLYAKRKKNSISGEKLNGKLELIHTCIDLFKRKQYTNALVCVLCVFLVWFTHQADRSLF